MKKIIKYLLLIIFFSAFIFSAYKIISYIIEGNKSKQLNKNLIENSIEIIYDDLNNKKEINVDFESLKKENKDIVGWIYLDDSNINYPVVQAWDNEYYLRRLLNGNYNICGTIFMDAENNANLTDRNTIIYGHNMKNGTMFADLIKNRKQEYYDTHKEILYCTPEKKYNLKLFAGLTINDNSYIYNYNIDSNKIKEIIKKSDFKTDIDVLPEDKIITLSTCAYEYENARYVVMGVLK